MRALKEALVDSVIPLQTFSSLQKLCHPRALICHPRALICHPRAGGDPFISAIDLLNPATDDCAALWGALLPVYRPDTYQELDSLIR